MAKIDDALLGLSTIQEVIDYHKGLELNHEKLFLKSKVNDLIFNTKFILDDYKDFLADHILTVTLSDKEFAKYKYRPKSLCFDVYGNAELSFLVLRLNNMSSALDFTKRNLSLPKLTIFDFISEVLILEEDRITKNNESIK